MKFTGCKLLDIDGEVMQFTRTDKKEAKIHPGEMNSLLQRGWSLLKSSERESARGSTA